LPDLRKGIAGIYNDLSRKSSSELLPGILADLSVLMNKHDYVSQAMQDRVKVLWQRLMKNNDNPREVFKVLNLLLRDLGSLEALLDSRAAQQSP
jgi:hypothetical protein